MNLETLIPPSPRDASCGADSSAPPVPIRARRIIASGTFSAEKVRDYPQLQIAAVLPKPFGHWEFLDTVRHALQAPGEAAAADDGTFHQLHANPQLIR
jgi:hypothetical protein